MATFSSRWNQTTSAFAMKLRQSAKLISNSCVQLLESATQQFLSMADVPIYTGNLQDSVGVQILRNRQLLTMQMMEKMATRPQYWRPEPGTPTQKIWGRQRLALMIGRARNVSSSGITAQLLVAAPYAQMVNDTLKHAGYLNRLTIEFVETMSLAVKRLEAQKWVV